LINRLFEDSRMDEVKRTPLIVLLARLVGFTFGAATLGFAALLVGISLLSFAPGGIHSDGRMLCSLEPWCALFWAELQGPKEPCAS
jgi:hypothetical protein